jgi:hypothetical protein
MRSIKRRRGPGAFVWVAQPLLAVLSRLKGFAVTFSDAWVRLVVSASCGDRSFVAQGALLPQARMRRIKRRRGPGALVWVAQPLLAVLPRLEGFAVTFSGAWVCLGSPCFVWRPQFCSPGRPAASGANAPHKKDAGALGLCLGGTPTPGCAASAQGIWYKTRLFRLTLFSPNQLLLTFQAHSRPALFTQT